MRKFLLDIRYTIYVEELKATCGNDDYIMPYFFGRNEVLVEAKTLPEAIYKAIDITKKKNCSCNGYQTKAIQENKIYFDVRLKMKV